MRYQNGSSWGSLADWQIATFPPCSHTPGREEEGQGEGKRGSGQHCFLGYPLNSCQVRAKLMSDQTSLNPNSIFTLNTGPLGVRASTCELWGGGPRSVHSSGFAWFTKSWAGSSLSLVCRTHATKPSVLVLELPCPPLLVRTVPPSSSLTLRRPEAELRWRRDRVLGLPGRRGIADLVVEAGSGNSLSPPRAPAGSCSGSFLRFSTGVLASYFSAHLCLLIIPSRIPWALRWASELHGRHQRFLIFLFVPAPRGHDVKWLRACIELWGWATWHTCARHDAATHLGQHPSRGAVGTCLSLHRLCERPLGGVIFREWGRVTIILTSSNSSLTVYVCVFFKTGQIRSSHCGAVG